MMWQKMEANPRQITVSLNHKRPIAYTTVATVMGHLVEKNLLSRFKRNREYLYKVTMDKNELIRETFKRKFRTIMDDFGDLATQWLWEEISIYQ